MTAPNQPPHAPVMIDAVNTSVTLIEMYGQDTAGNPIRLGTATGFFFASAERKYLITNKHVVASSQGYKPLHLVIQVHTNPNSLVQNRRISIPLYDTGNNKLWSEHPNIANVDVVAIDITGLMQQTDVIFYFGTNNFLPNNVMLMSMDKCAVIGYPLGFYDHVHNLPITRGGAIASAYRAHFRGEPLFLVDAFLHPGTSGSPVILPSSSMRQTGNGIALGFFPHYLLGINSGEYQVNGNKLGLNAVWYAELITDII